MPFVIFIILFISFIVGAIFAKGISYMNDKHPDYKGEDFLELPNKPKF
jgi:hypothetical protein